MAHISLGSSAAVKAAASFEKDLIVVDAISVQDEIDNIDDKFLDQQGTGRSIINIQAFDPQIEPEETIFPVGILDGIMPRMLVPVTCTYHLDNDVPSNTVLSNVCEGLRRLMGDYRFLAGALYEPEGSGRAFVRRTASHANFVVHVQDLAITDPSFPSFAELKRRHFPASELDERMLPDSFTPSPVPLPGEGIPAMVAQLNLIQGGLVMGIAVHHLLVDARGLDKLLARWAAHTRSVFDPTRFPPPPPLQPCDLEPVVLNMGASWNAGEIAIDYRKQAVASLKYAPNAPPTSDIPPSAMEQHIWHIPASKLVALKASRVCGPDDATQQWVSTNDCVTALMWRAITRSRLAVHGITSPAHDTRPVALENSLDVRRAFDVGSSSGIPEDYVGNVVMFSKASMPLCQLVAPETFRAVAVKIREAVEEYRAWPTVRRAMQWIAACPRGADVEMDFVVVGGLDVVTTSWRVLRAYEHADFGFGPLMALRWATAVFDGYCFLYPTRPSGHPDEGVEIYLGLQRDCMQRLLLDQELAKWADVRN